jgi:hypothetical protein
MAKSGTGPPFQIRYSCPLRAKFIDFFIHFVARAGKSKAKGERKGRQVRTHVFFFPALFSRSFSLSLFGRLGLSVQTHPGRQLSSHSFPVLFFFAFSYY